MRYFYAQKTSYDRALNGRASRRQKSNGKLLTTEMEVKEMEISHDQDGFTLIKYAEDKRPLKLSVYWIDCPESEDFFQTIMGYVISNANHPKHIATMPPEKFFALVERLATMFCKEYSPTSTYGVTKPEIRGAIYFVLNAAIQAGEWPEKIEITKQTFVQYWSGDGNE